MTGIFTRIGCPARGTGVAVGGTGVAVGGDTVATGVLKAAAGEPLGVSGVAGIGCVGVAGAAVGVAGTVVAVGAAATVVGEADTVVAAGARLGVAAPPHAPRNRESERRSAAIAEPRPVRWRIVNISEPTLFFVSATRIEACRTIRSSIGD
jgi:hypothetical protein